MLDPTTAPMATAALSLNTAGASLSTAAGALSSAALLQGAGARGGFLKGLGATALALWKKSAPIRAGIAASVATGSTGARSYKREQVTMPDGSVKVEITNWDGSPVSEAVAKRERAMTENPFQGPLGRLLFPTEKEKATREAESLQSSITDLNTMIAEMQAKDAKYRASRPDLPQPAGLQALLDQRDRLVSELANLNLKLEGLPAVEPMTDAKTLEMPKVEQAETPLPIKLPADSPAPVEVLDDGEMVAQLSQTIDGGSTLIGDAMGTGADAMGTALSVGAEAVGASMQAAADPLTTALNALTNAVKSVNLSGPRPAPALAHGLDTGGSEPI